MAALPGEGIEVEGQGSYKCFAFTSFHLGYLALMKDNPPCQLNIEVPLLYGSLGCFPDSSISLRQNLIQVRAIPEPRLKLIGLGSKLRVAESLEFRLQLVYVIDQRLKAPQFFLVGINQTAEPLNHD
jgi:hypothetical protein